MSTPPTLVNSIYPVSYFALPGVDQIQYPDTNWWASKARYASIDSFGNYLSTSAGGFQTSEILEVDLGRTRGINYINFDVLRAPINITIQYDALSSPDRSDAVWADVASVSGLPFDDAIYYDADVRTSWFNAEFNFTDTKGNLIQTRYLRITFSRQDVPWPTATAGPFAWPVMVKHMRLGRYIDSLTHTAGPLLNQETPLTRNAQTLTPTVDSETSFQARQQFVIPASAIRAGVTPNMLGMGLLIETNPGTGPDPDTSSETNSVAMQWSLWDVTDQAAPVNILSGVESVAVAPGETWLDWYFDEAQIVAGDTTKIYELRVLSQDMDAMDTLFTTTPNSLSSTAIPGTLTFTTNSTVVSTSVDTTSVVKVGDYLVRNDVPSQVYIVNGVNSSDITLNTPFLGTTGSAPSLIIYPYTFWDSLNNVYTKDASQALIMRIWGDVADEGRDVLGNAYRYVVRRQQAEYVQDGSKAGWMSDPVPTPDAVEALYFDVRGTNGDGQKVMSLIEAINIAPRTPGVRMNVYWSQENTGGDAPATTNDWDYLLWQPIQETYTLRRNEIIQLPHPLKASYIKLEFTALNPLPYRIPSYPPLPPKTYRRFPTWVEDQYNNSQIRNLIQGWFLRNATPVETSVLQSLSDPVLEFEYEQREFFAALALGTITDQQVINSGLVDIADKAIIDPTTASKIYISTSSDYQNTLLLSVDPSSVLGQAVIARYDPTTITDPLEKTAASQTSTVPTVSTSNDRLSESYSNMVLTPMRFNVTSRHAYTIEQAEYNKKAYFVGIDTVAFLRNDYTVMYDESVISDTLFDDLMLTDNTFQPVEGTTIPDGSTVYATYWVNNTLYTDEAVFLSGANPIQLVGTGGPVRDLLVFSSAKKQGVQFWQNDDYDLEQGTDDNGQRVTSIARSALTGRLAVPLQPIIYFDAATVKGVGVIPQMPTFDAATVVAKAVLTSSDGPFVPDYGAGTYGGSAAGAPTAYGAGNYGSGEYGGVGFGSADYGDLASVYVDASQTTSVGEPTTTSEGRQDSDSATVVSVAVPSGTDTYTP